MKNVKSFMKKLFISRFEGSADVTQCDIRSREVCYVMERTVLSACAMVHLSIHQ